jgi:hypothetical protein
LPLNFFFLPPYLSRALAASSPARVRSRMMLRSITQGGKDVKFQLATRLRASMKSNKSRKPE